MGTQGSRRTKLGLREIISLGDFVQSIDTKQSHAVRAVLCTTLLNQQLLQQHYVSSIMSAAHPSTVAQVNKVHFSARGLALLEGALTITASYEPASPTRVNIAFQSANLVRSQR